MAISGISTLATRQAVIDFLDPHWFEPSAVVYKPYSVKWWYFIKPFSSAVWACVVGATLIIAVVLTIMHIMSAKLQASHTNVHIDIYNYSFMQQSRFRNRIVTGTQMYGYLLMDYLNVCLACILYQGM